MRSARIALQEAYSIFLTSPEQEMFVAPKQGYKVERAKPRRVVRDKDGKIIETPDPMVTGSESFAGRTSTNHRCAVAIFDSGRILMAAEGRDQPEILARWNRFAYNPAMDMDRRVRNILLADLIRDVFCLWAFSPKQRRPNLDNPVRLVRLVGMVIEDSAHRFKSGSAPNVRTPEGKARRITVDDYAQRLGYDSANGASWYKTWHYHWEDIYGVVDNIDRLALKPITELLIERERMAECDG